MTLVQYKFDIGTQGDTITTANTGASSVILNGGSAILDAGVKAHGNYGVKVTSAATTNTLMRLNTNAANNSVGFSGVVQLPSAAVANSTTFMSLRYASGVIMRLQLRSTGTLGILDSANTLVQFLTSAQVSPYLGQKMRIELGVTSGSTTAGSYTAKAYDFSSGTQIGSTLTITNANLTTNQISAGDFGQVSTDNPAGVVIGWDDIQLNDGTTTPPAPLTDSTPPTAAFTHTESGASTTVDGTSSSATSGASISSWSWNWGDSSTGTGSRVSHTYASSGTYTVQLTVTDTNGNTNSTSQSVTVAVPTSYVVYKFDTGNGVTQGAAVTTANSGASTTNAAGGGSIIYDAGMRAHGPYGAKYTNAASNIAITRLLANNANTAMSFSGVVVMPDAPIPASTDIALMTLRHASGVVAQFGIRSTGSQAQQLFIKDSASTVTIVAPDGSWSQGLPYRIVMIVSGASTTAGNITVKVYQGNTTKLIATATTLTNANVTTNAIVGGDFGLVSGMGTNSYTDGWDDVQFADGSVAELAGLTTTNNPPVANAGSDQTVQSGSVVTLDGSASVDGDGIVAGYTWTQVSGPSVTMIADTSVRPTFVAPPASTQQTLVFSLTVVDDQGTSSVSPDTVSITVLAAYTYYLAGDGTWKPDQNIVIPGTIVTSGNPTITTQPSISSYSVQLDKSDSITFTTAATAGTVQWQRSADYGATWTNISGATNPTLTHAATTANGYSMKTDYQFRAVWTGTSKTATTTISGVVNIRPSRPAMATVNMVGTDIVSFVAGLSSPSVVVLPAGTFTFSDFTQGGGVYGIWSANLRGFVGAGIGQTIIKMNQGTSTKASSVPTQSQGGTNQLYMIRLGQGGGNTDPTYLCDLTIEGTDQGHLYNGVMNYVSQNSYWENVQFIGTGPGDWSSPPGETFSMNDYKCVNSYYRNIEVDGRYRNSSTQTNGSPFGGNNSNGTIVDDCWFHHSYVSGFTFSFAGSTSAPSQNVKTHRVKVQHNANTVLAPGKRFACLNQENVLGSNVHVEYDAQRDNMIEWDDGHFAINSKTGSGKQLFIEPIIHEGYSGYKGAIIVALAKTYASVPNAQAISDVTIIKNGVTLSPVTTTAGGNYSINPATQYIVAQDP